MYYLNVSSIGLFVASLIFFNICFATSQTREVLIYFIPDMGLTVLNAWVTFIVSKYTDTNKILSFLENVFVKWSINLGYYINVVSAIFYLYMLLDEKLLHTGLMDPFS